MPKNPWLTPSQALNRPLNRQAGDTAQILEDVSVVTRRLGFQVGNFGLLIAQQSVSELSDVLDICPIPFTASWLIGLINLRGNLMPVFNLHILFQIKAKENVKQMLLILGQGERAGAIIIDNLPVHLSFVEQDELQSLPPLPAVLKPYVTSGYEKEGQVWFNFDNENFFESLASQL